MSCDASIPAEQVFSSSGWGLQNRIYSLMRTETESMLFKCALARRSTSMRVPRAIAPPWMQKHGLEWLFRLTQEPHRLWRRYLVTNSLFVSKLIAALVLAQTSAIW